MGRFRIFSGKEVARILERNGFAFARQKGSQTVFQKNVGGNTVTVIVPNHPEVRTGTILPIIRQSRWQRLFET